MKDTTLAQIFNLLDRRFVIGTTSNSPKAFELSEAPQVANLRYGRLQVCATEHAAKQTTYAASPLSARLGGLALAAVLSLLLSACSCTWPGRSSVTPSAKDDSARLEWWREARFGLFVHWGPVSLRGTEIGWSRGAQVPADEYDRLYQQFNPTNFNARQWARIARDAGARYLVITSKHHDGFCIWDSEFTDYDMASTPFRRNVLKELADACRREGIVFCTYHSICDWHHPDYPLGSPGGKSPKPAPNMDRYNVYLKNQLREIVTGYGPLGIMWFDGEWEAPWTDERGSDLYQFVRGLQPGIIINNRVAKARKGMAGSSQAGAFSGDYDTPEQQIGKFQNDRPWESCITICQQWAWKPNDQLKSLHECLRTLVYCAGGDGNLLLNVGPMPDGRIEPRQVERLREMGQWLRRYGHSIYGTRGGPFKPGTWGASTHRGRKLYLHLLDTKSDAVVLPAIPSRIARSSVLTGGKADVVQNANGISVRILPEHRQPIDTIVVLELDKPAAELKALDVTTTNTPTTLGK